MNLLDKQNTWQWLIAAIAIVLVACEEPGEIGLDLGQQDNQLDVNLKVINLPASNVFIDSVRTDLSGQFLVGTYDDPTFGKVTAEAYTQFNLDFEGDPIVNPDAQLDSLVLHLRPSFYHGTDFSGQQEINVYRLTDTLFSEVTYLSKFATERTRVPIGTARVTILPDTDSLISIRLDQVFAEQLFEEAREFIAPDVFQRELKGLAIGGGANNSVIIGFDPVNEDTRMSIYYQIPSLNIDSIEYRFEFNGDNTVRYNQYRVDRSNSILSGINPHEEFVAPTDEIYLQPGTGILPVIDFGPFIEWADSLDNYVINRAELEISPNLTHSAFNQIEYPNEVRYLYFENGNINGPGVTLDPRSSIILSDNSYLVGSFEPLSHTYDPIVRQGYIGTMTIFLELLADGRLNVPHKAAVQPRTISSLNQATFPKNGFRLKVYYTSTRNNF